MRRAFARPRAEREEDGRFSPAQEFFDFRSQRDRIRRIVVTKSGDLFFRAPVRRTRSEMAAVKLEIQDGRVGLENRIANRSQSVLGSQLVHHRINHAAGNHLPRRPDKLVPAAAEISAPGPAKVGARQRVGGRHDAGGKTYRRPGKCRSIPPRPARGKRSDAQQSHRARAPRPAMPQRCGKSPARSPGSPACERNEATPSHRQDFGMIPDEVLARRLARRDKTQPGDFGLRFPIGMPNEGRLMTRARLRPRPSARNGCRSPCEPQEVRSQRMG